MRFGGQTLISTGWGPRTARKPSVKTGDWSAILALLDCKVEYSKPHFEQPEIMSSAFESDRVEVAMLN